MLVEIVPLVQFLAQARYLTALNLIDFLTILKLDFNSSYLLRGALVEIVPPAQFLA